jgi:hypothetical protein
MSATEAGFLGLLFSGILALPAGMILTRLHWRPDIPPYGRHTRFLDVTLHPDRYVNDAPLHAIQSLTASERFFLPALPAWWHTRSCA